MSDPDSDATKRPTAASPAPEPTAIYRPLDSASELVRVLDQYLADLQAGLAPDKARLLADHAELARQLEDCLAGIEFVHRTAKPVTETPAQLGDFQIIREVGRGGMGVVYEALQLSLKRKVALKVLRFGVTTDPEVMQRFQREAETVAHLHHTNIVPIHAVGCEQGVHYYAMQFIEGQSLAAVAEELRQGATTHVAGADRFEEVAGWMLQAAEALAHAHQRGVIHRDIKPSNLILDPEGTVWLTDFGLAKRADEVTLTAAGILMGTPRYMSPEQAATTRQPIDHRTDIYSLGATLYELATGKPVFESQTPQGVITQILNAEPVAPRLVQGHLPRDLETIILKCLAKEPARRYQTARDLADDLRAFLDNRPIRARRMSMAERAVRWMRKSRRSAQVAGLAAAASTLLIAAGATMWNAYKESLNGRLSLTTDGPSLVAEVLDDHDELVIPSFPVPNPEPVVLTAGSYRVRLSASGQPSETWRMDVPRGDLVTYPVKLIDRSLSPQDVLGIDPPPLIELDGRQHILVGASQGWRLLNGATWQSLWPADWKWPETPLTPTDSRTLVGTEEWRKLLQGYSEIGHYAGSDISSPGIAGPAVDIDGDGRQDLVFASRNSPSLLAVSAQSGTPLWWFRAPPPVPVEHDLVADPLVPSPAREIAVMIGQPITVDMDGEPAIVSLVFWIESNALTKSGKQLNIKHQLWLEVAAARTGKPLWRTLVKALDPGAYYLTLIQKLPRRPVVVQLGQQQAVIAVIESQLFAADLATGRPFEVAQPGTALAQAPQFGDLDGDSRTDVLFVERQKENPQTLLLKAVSLESRATLWERSILPAGRVDHFQPLPAGAELAWITSRGDNRKADVMVAIRDDQSQYQPHWFGLEALDGATGQPRWNQKLWSFGQFSSSGNLEEGLRMAFQRAFWTEQGVVAPAATGPDLDGDGIPELFAVSVGSLHLENMRSLRVDAL
jgi:serine/threonine protein kinase